jgi:hypothetical protein
MAIWFILWPFGMHIFLWTFGTFYGYLVYFLTFCYICCTKKNLATLLPAGPHHSDWISYKTIRFIECVKETRCWIFILCILPPSILFRLDSP